MLLIVISALIILAGRTNGGYINLRPSDIFELPQKEPDLQEQIQREFLPEETIESEVSYSVPFQRYYDLHHIRNLKSSNLYASEVGSAVIASLAEVHQQSNLEINSMRHHNIPLKNEQSSLIVNARQHIPAPVVKTPIKQNSDSEHITYSHVNVPAIPTVNSLSQTEQSNLEVNAVQHIDIPALNIPSVSEPAYVQFPRNAEFVPKQDYIQPYDNSNLNTSTNVQKIAPEIIKHLYFHVPPAEIEELPERTITPKIKDYKIIFIKVPSQDRRNIGLLQGNAINQVPPIEEKTIIYILSKSTAKQVSLSKSLPSQHEVFFVQYNGKESMAKKYINDNLDQINP